MHSWTANWTPFSDQAVRDLIQQLCIEPYPVERDWDYGAPRQRHVCWMVLEHPPSNTGLEYCEAGFGPVHPRGLVNLSGSRMNIGMDSAWFARLEDAVRESLARTGPTRQNMKWHRPGVRKAVPAAAPDAGHGRWQESLGRVLQAKG